MWNKFFNYEPTKSFYVNKLIGLYGFFSVLVFVPDIGRVYSGFIIERGFNEKLNSDYLFSIQDIVEFLNAYVFEFDLWFDLILFMYLLGFALLIVGRFTIVASTFVWLLQVVFMDSASYFIYGADLYLGVLLFFCVLYNIAKNLNEPFRRVLAPFSFRWLQITLSISYFFTGFGKLLGVDWLNGDAISKILFFFLDISVPGVLAPLFVVMGLAVVALELLYPVFVAFQKTRVLVVCMICTMHLGIIFIMGLYSFGLIMILINLIAFSKDVEEFVLTKINPLLIFYKAVY